MEFRASYNEEITQDSWLMRDLWQITNSDRGKKEWAGKISEETEKQRH